MPTSAALPGGGVGQCASAFATGAPAIQIWLPQLPRRGRRYWSARYRLANRTSVLLDQMCRSCWQVGNGHKMRVHIRFLEHLSDTKRRRPPTFDLVGAPKGHPTRGRGSSLLSV